MLDELDEFIDKWVKLAQAGKEATLVLKTQAGNAWAQLSVHLGQVGSSQKTQQQNARGALDVKWPSCPFRICTKK